MPETDWQSLLALRGVRDTLQTLEDDEIDVELHAAVDALLLAARVCRGWRVAVASVWLAYRVGILVGRLRD